MRLRLPSFPRLRSHSHANEVRSQREPSANENANAPANDGASRPRAARRSWAAALSRLRQRSHRDRARWANRALAWPLVNWLEGAVWFLVALTLAVSYYGSYDNLVDVLSALGYALGPARVVPVALDAPLTCSVIGQFLLARWKSPARRRWRLFAVTLVTAPLSLAGNALHGALAYGAHGAARLDLSLLDLHRLDVWIRLVAAMVPAIGIILAVSVAELVLRERARLEELSEREPASDEESESDAHDGSQRGSQDEPPPPPRTRERRIDPRVLRLARTGGDWKAVKRATGLTDAGAKRALTAARKQLAADSQAASESDSPGATGQEVAA